MFCQFYLVEYHLCLHMITKFVSYSVRHYVFTLTPLTSEAVGYGAYPILTISILSGHHLCYFCRLFKSDILLQVVIKHLIPSYRTAAYLLVYCRFVVFLRTCS